MFVKVFDIQNETVDMYKIDDPVFVKKQAKTDSYIRCPFEYAEGIVISGSCVTLSLSNGTDINNESVYAEIITQTAYEEYLASQEQIDVEDETPQATEDVPEETILTRAELTQYVEELEKQNRFLQDCLLEMSEIVYQ